MQTSAKYVAGATDPSRSESTTDCSNPADKTWPVPVAALLCWLLPATAAMRTQRASLIRVYLLHVLVVVAAALLIFQFGAWADSKPLLVVLAGAWNELEQSPPRAGGVIFLVLAGIELFHLAVAVLFTPWGARDEALRDSFRNALRQAWLHTVHFLVVIAFFGCLAMAVQALFARWKLPSLDVPPGLIGLPLGAATAAWIAFALARAIGAYRYVPPIQRPPTCSSCGYNLTMIPMEGRCPECGSSVSDSLGEDTSPSCAKCHYNLKGLSVNGRCPECFLHVSQSIAIGRQTRTPWEKCYSMRGIPRAWWKTARLALHRPEELGRMIWLTAPTAHRSFLAMHLPLIFLIASGSLILHIARVERNIDLLLSVLIGCVSITFGIVCTLAAFGVVNLAAVLIAIPQPLQTKRNMLSASIQMACYLMPYIVAWELFGALVILGLTSEAFLFEALAEIIGVLPEFLAMGTFVLSNFVIVALYFHLVARGTKAARYANK